MYIIIFYYIGINEKNLRGHMGNLLRTFMDVLVIVDHGSLASGHDSFVGRVMYLQMVFNFEAVHSCFFENGTGIDLERRVERVAKA